MSGSPKDIWSQRTLPCPSDAKDASRGDYWFPIFTVFSLWDGVSDLPSQTSFPSAWPLADLGTCIQVSSGVCSSLDAKSQAHSGLPSPSWLPSAGASSWILTLSYLETHLLSTSVILRTFESCSQALGLSLPPNSRGKSPRQGVRNQPSPGIWYAFPV